MFRSSETLAAYTRADALEDGALVDCSALAQTAGFCWPVAVTQAVWELITDIPPTNHVLQDVDGRLWDVLTTASQQALIHPNTPVCHFTVRLMHSGGHTQAFKLVAHPGDRGEPVVTIMLPYETTTTTHSSGGPYGHDH